MENQAQEKPNTVEKSPLSEAERLKLMDVALKFCYSEADFLIKYNWLHSQASNLANGVSLQSLAQHWGTGMGDWGPPFFPAKTGHSASGASEPTPTPENRPGGTSESVEQTSHT